MEPKPGDPVEIAYEGQMISGVLMPQENEFLVLKLKSGYNAGFSRKKVNGIKVLPAKEKQKAVPQKITKKKELPTISILHTGGTVASKVDYETGGVSAHFSPEELLAIFPELRDTANLNSRFIGNLMSENLRFVHYNLLAQEIKKEIEAGSKGVIVTHGTDTLHYTAAALAFVLDGISLPIILVGAQRSSDRGSSDAALNLISAAAFIANSDFVGVAICMHENNEDDNCLILPACKTRKMHTSRRDAFRPINANPIARINQKTKKITFITAQHPKKEAEDGKKGLKLKLFNEKIKVGIIKTHTNMFAEQFLAYKGYDGLVVEGTGLGQIPNTKLDANTAENEKILNAVKELCKNTVVVMAPQTIYGRIDMNVYKEGRLNLQAGIVGNYSDMTPETAFIKLAWLLSNYSKEEAKKLISHNLRGEISERTSNEGFLQ